MKITISAFFTPMLLFLLKTSLTAQTITGAWRGKINNTPVELKIIKSGDSLSGTAYYYTSKNNYRRYAIKGYFDGRTNDVIWWDDWLIEDHSRKPLSASQEARLNVADFNCPGEDEMLLDGSSSLKEDIESPKKELHLQKTNEHLFNDEWDWVIENYFVGANDPYVIDSINQLQGSMPFPEEKEILAAKPPTAEPVTIGKPKVSAGNTPAEKEISSSPIKSPEEKFSSRKKVVQTVIPITAKTIELRFYDNAQIDGDSIALFLNNRMIFKNIRLTDQPYTVKLNASELNEDNELVMVAENLGSIPPNTSFMVAIVGDKRYEARLYANENSSAVIRLVKPKDQ